MSQYLSEAFKRLDALNEDTFAINDNGIEDLVKFRDEDEYDNSIDVIDPEATSEEELQDSYVGKVILDCCVCHSKIYKDVEDVVIDGDLANIDEECPFCYTTDGYKVIGQVASFDGPETEKESTEDEAESSTPKNEGLFSKKDKQLYDVWCQDGDEKWTSLEGVPEKEADQEIKDAIANNEGAPNFKAWKEPSRAKNEAIKRTKKGEAEEYKKVTFADVKKGDYVMDHPKDETAKPQKVIKIERDGDYIDLIFRNGNMSGSANSTCFVFTKADMKTRKRNAKEFDSGKRNINDYDWFSDEDGAYMQRRQQESVRTNESLYEAKTFQNQDIYRIHSGKEEIFMRDLPEKDAKRIVKDLQKDARNGDKYTLKPAVDKDGKEAPIKTRKEVRQDKKAAKAAEDEKRGYKDTVANKLRMGGLPSQRFAVVHDDGYEDTHLTKKQARGAVAAAKRDGKEAQMYRQKFDKDGNVRQDDKFKRENWKRESTEDGQHYQSVEDFVSDNYDTLLYKTALEVLKVPNCPMEDCLLGRILWSEPHRHQAPLKDGIMERVGKSSVLKKYITNYTIQELKDLDSIPGAAKELANEFKNIIYSFVNFGSPQRKNESLKENINNISLDTDTTHFEVTTEDGGKMTITTEPLDSVENGEEVIAPINPEVQSEISDNVGDGEEIEIDVDEFDEESFDELGESYLKKVYENVNSFKTSRVALIKNKLVVEGVIKFNSGKSKKTNFIFESREATKSGKVRFIGENKEISRGKKSFTVTGRIKDNKFLSESLNYNYGVKGADGKAQRLYGTVRRSK